MPLPFWKLTFFITLHSATKLRFLKFLSSIKINAEANRIPQGKETLSFKSALVITLPPFISYQHLRCSAIKFSLHIFPSQIFYLSYSLKTLLPEREMRQNIMTLPHGRVITSLPKYIKLPCVHFSSCCQLLRHFCSVVIEYIYDKSELHLLSTLNH